MDKSKQMSMIKILDINAPFIREASSANFEEDLNHEIETKLAGLEVKGLPYERADIIELISSIETEKMRCLEGEISATQLYHYCECEMVWRLKDEQVEVRFAGNEMK